ncbi:hypothetical protein E2562_024939 [Oryza meyeriana var. granulata]|uniref:non-specific serine/threonine protein kinase n=1 Tax=Oryza meyeriana var. granulata TaxID=110450 RepID=A0A6G1DP50_9ORYZ|nr:hypothetical protein E2562_024939 [Oryza meyeriana var. granulata]
MTILLVIVGLHLCSLHLPVSSAATDTLSPGQPLTGDDKLISSNGKFALGFFQTGSKSSGNATLNYCCMKGFSISSPDSWELGDRTDFGMAKLLGRDFSRVVTTARGTIGYLAPEWISGMAITPKIDVYAYGMLLEGGVLSLVDDKLNGDVNVEEVERACAKAWRFYDPTTHRAVVSRDAVFDELASWSWRDEDEDMEAGTDFVVEYLAMELGATRFDADTVKGSWVYKVKKNAAGEVINHKVRLVAKGYVQQPGVDFDEVFAPVARIELVRLLLALAAQEGWSVHHMDVKSAFLNGELIEEVYVRQPPGFTVAGHEDKVLRLDKAHYGLRQAPQAWNTKLDETLVALGFSHSALEHAVYARGKGASRLLGAAAGFGPVGWQGLRRVMKRQGGGVDDECGFVGQRAGITSNR